MMGFRVVQQLQRWCHRNRRTLPDSLTRLMLFHGVVPALAIIAGLATLAAFLLPFRIVPSEAWDRYRWMFGPLSDEGAQGILVALLLVISGLTLALCRAGRRRLTSTTEARLLRLCSAALLALSIPVADSVVLGLALAGIVALAWGYGPAALQYFGLIESEADPYDERR